MAKSTKSNTSATAKRPYEGIAFKDLTDAQKQEVIAFREQERQEKGLTSRFVNVIAFKGKDGQKGDIVRVTENAWTDEQGNAYNRYQFRVREARRGGAYYLASKLVPASNESLNKFYASLTNRRGMAYSMTTVTAKDKVNDKESFLTVWDMFERPYGVKAQEQQAVEVAEEDLPY